MKCERSVMGEFLGANFACVHARSCVYIHVIVKVSSRFKAAATMLTRIRSGMIEQF